MPDRLAFLSYSNASGGLSNIRTQLNENEETNSVICGATSPMIARVISGGSFTGSRCIVAWGKSAVLPDHPDVFYLNNVEKDKYINKHDFFALFSEVIGLSSYLPEAFYTQGQAVSFTREHTRADNEPVLVERQILRGHSGAGIKLIRRPEHVSSAGRLWVTYKRKKDEWRVHFFKQADGSVELFVQKKLLRVGFAPPADQPESPYKVRNYTNGWVYSPNRTDAPARVYAAAASFINVADLTFGAIDIIYNVSSGHTWILEVNTAPGAVETTAKWYADMIGKYYTSIRDRGTVILPTTERSFVSIPGRPRNLITLESVIARNL